MNICMYVCMYVLYAYIRVYACMYICMHVCIHVCIYVIFKLGFERYGGNCPSWEGELSGGNFPGGKGPGGMVQGGNVRAPETLPYPGTLVCYPRKEAYSSSYFVFNSRFMIVNHE